jgi:saccharopine dehydrogenase-like NADP-dependent oxidoreductase
MRVAIVGAGAVGARASRQLASTDDVERIVVYDPDAARVGEIVGSLGERIAAAGEGHPSAASADVVILAGPAAGHAELAEALVARSVNVVSTADDVVAVRDLLALDAQARDRGAAVAVGAAFGPGLSCVLAAHGATPLDHVDEIHVARVGTGGPACAAQHHEALAGTALDWREGQWIERRGGSGRELCWFPEPIGGADCYRAALPDALLLVPAFPDVQRVTVRMGANRRDRVTAHLPMLRKPHPEGGPGAIRVEIRGRRGSAVDVNVFGVMDRPAVAAGAVAALVAVTAGRGELSRTGAGGLAEMVAPLPLLAELARRGVKAAVFEGVS